MMSVPADRIISEVASRLKPDQNGFHLTVKPEFSRADGDWVTVVVEAGGSGRMSELVGIFERLEKQLSNEFSAHVLIVPAAPAD